MPQIPELIEMLKNGVHFGHQVSKRHPKMMPFIFGARNQISIIDLEKTAEELKKALDFVTKIVATDGVVLFVSSKDQAKDIVKKEATNCQMPFISSRWLGGTFTNFDNIIRLTNKLKELEQQRESGELSKYTKKEQLDFEREITRLTDLVGGIKEMTTLPDAIFLVDIKKEKTALAEAKKVGVPTVAMVDANDNPEKVNFPIPANNDAIKSIQMITELVSKAVIEGRGSKKVEELPVKKDK
ncbi:30S ribosomal protein S2 [bacterium]|jgi:small subunit ribosomal protein S2|nr:30S ribosomal protein S2 [bacterium]MBT4335385.1 30S ribosomal protein S2 [bacterium]MBT4495504.1 30S ribosomal protein S2 [bacterium]MBT4764316.1 30S ribosomal protein S2 [bacterium]MBT5401687.1 30S ribosomal protein S2 [bacterium]